MLVQLRLNGELYDEVDQFGRRVSPASIVEEFSQKVTVAPAHGNISTENLSAAFDIDHTLSRLMEQGDLVTNEKDHFRVVNALAEHLRMLKGERSN